MIIDGVEIGGPCRFVAEISNNHNGDLDRAFRLIEAAKESGCDFVKFQAYTPDELVALRGDGPAPEPWGSEGWSMRDLYRKAQTPLGWFPELVGKCREVGVAWFSSVFGAESLMQLEYVGCPAYKIARLDNNDVGLGEMVLATGKPVLISAKDEYEAAMDNPPERVQFLYCPEGYPQKFFRPSEFPKGFLGLSFHGTDERIPALMAVRGAKLVEFHFQLAAEPSELEANVSLNEHQTFRMIDDVREREFIRAA